MTLVLISFRVVDLDGDLIGVIVPDDEPVVEEETGVALLPIRVEDLFVTRDVMDGLDDEASLLICVSPRRLLGTFMVQHISHWYEAIGLHLVDVHSKDPRRDHHSDLTEVLEVESRVLGHIVTDHLVVLLDVLDLLLHLVQEG